MKVVILAGGYGSRFGKVTDLLPKPMIPVGPFPILWHIMRYYSHFGHNEFILCTGYKSEVVKEFFLNLDAYSNDFTLDFETGREDRMHVHSSDNTFSPKVTVAYTGQDSMTGARIKRIEQYLDNDEEFMLTYGDGVTDINLDELVRFHREHGKLATLSAVYPPAKFGDLHFEGQLITKFSEKSGNQGALINGGYYVFKREVLDYLEADQGCVLEKEPLSRLSEQGELMGYQHTGYWQCMDTTRDLEGLQSAWATGNAPWRVWSGGYED